MTVYYNRTGRLGLGHTIPVGEPWLPGSACDHLLISLPYPFGAELRTCHVGDLHVEVLWLVPITVTERDFKAAHGQEALEQPFEDASLRYWDIGRASVVEHVAGCFLGLVPSAARQDRRGQLARRLRRPAGEQ